MYGNIKREPSQPARNTGTSRKHGRGVDGDGPYGDANYKRAEFNGCASGNVF